MCSKALFNDISDMIETSVRWDDNRLLHVYEGVAQRGDSGGPILDKRGFAIAVLFSVGPDERAPLFLGTPPSYSDKKLGLK